MNEEEADSSPVAIIWVAIAILAAFGLFTLYMVGQTGTGDVRWTRLTFLYAGVEAVVVGAAGLLFGTEIKRKQASAAEKRAEEAEANASEDARTAAAVKAVRARLRTLVAADREDRRDESGRLLTRKIRGIGPEGRPATSEQQALALDLLRFMDALDEEGQDG